MQQPQSISRIFDLTEICNEKFPEKIAFYTSYSKKWQPTTFRQYYEEATKLSIALLNADVQKNDKIITISRNRAEFNFVDIGCLQVGAVHVPLYTNIDNLKLQAIAKETKCALVFVDSLQQLDRLQLMHHQLPDLKRIVCFDKEEGEYSYKQFLQHNNTKEQAELLLIRKSKIKPEDLASITYISGSTTEVKGVEHSHYDHIHNFLAISESTCIKDNMKLLSLLPLAHSYERSINYCTQYLGATTWYNQSFRNIEIELKEIKPDVIFTVPLLAERLLSFLINRAYPGNSINKYLFAKAVRFAKKNEPSKKNFFNHFLKHFFDKIAYKKMRALTGNNLKMLYCGGASLRQEYRRFFDNCGIPCYEGYGLTEAGPVVTHNNPKNKKAGSVGKPIRDTLIKISLKGEVLVKSPSVFRSYHAKTAPTSMLDNDGYLFTGDTGFIDQEGYLTITGVKKRIFKLSNGVYVDPLPLETILNSEDGIKKSYIGGVSQNYLSAILIVDENYFATQKQIEINTLIADYRNSEFLNNYFSALIRQFNEDYRSFNAINTFILVTENKSETSFLFESNIDREQVHKWLFLKRKQAIKVK